MVVNERVNLVHGECAIWSIRHFQNSTSTLRQTPKLRMCLLK